MLPWPSPLLSNTSRFTSAFSTPLSVLTLEGQQNSPVAATKRFATVEALLLSEHLRYTTPLEYPSIPPWTTSRHLQNRSLIWSYFFGPKTVQETSMRKVWRGDYNRVAPCTVVIDNWILPTSWTSQLHCLISLWFRISFCIWATELESGISSSDTYSSSRLIRARNIVLDPFDFEVDNHRAPVEMRVCRARCHTELDDSRAQYTQGETCLPGGKGSPVSSSKEVDIYY